MEREMKNMKNLYEREITKLRLQLEDLGRQKSSIELQNSKLEATASDLQNRWVNVYRDYSTKAQRCIKNLLDV